MQINENNYAFIDGQNLNLGIKEIGWKLDLKRFRIYLKEKYGVTKAYYFIGFVEGNNDLYASLQEYGYILIFKPTFRNQLGKVKGNCDAELVLQSMIDIEKYDKAVIVTGDGDFYCLIKYLNEANKLKMVIAPNKSYSGLLKKSAKSLLSTMEDLKNRLEYIKRTP